MEERKIFYIGVKPCGCITACMVDDDKTAAKEEVSDPKNMHKTGRKMKHAEPTEAEFMASFKAVPMRASKHRNNRRLKAVAVD